MFSYTPDPSNCDSRNIFVSGHGPERDERPLEFDVMLQPEYHISRRFTISRDNPEDWRPFVSPGGEDVESSTNRAIVPCGQTVSQDLFFVAVYGSDPMNTLGAYTKERELLVSKSLYGPDECGGLSTSRGFRNSIYKDHNTTIATQLSNQTRRCEQQ